MRHKVHHMHMAALAVTEMCKMYTCSSQLLTENTRYATAFNESNTDGMTSSHQIPND